MQRELNWYGWSIETLAAVYETNQAAFECHDGLVDWEYLEAAFKAELEQQDLDIKFGVKCQ